MTNKEEEILERWESYLLSPEQFVRTVAGENPAIFEALHKGIVPEVEAVWAKHAQIIYSMMKQERR